jgi:hypothetical protein
MARSPTETTLLFQRNVVENPYDIATLAIRASITENILSGVIVASPSD